MKTRDYVTVNGVILRQLSKHFTVAEFVRSDTAIYCDIDNSMSKEVYLNAVDLCQHVLEPFREVFGMPVKVLSGYRCPKVNKLVKGASNSNHMEGKAVDFVVDGITLIDIFNYISEHIIFDQLIIYDTFIHVSYSIFCNRMERLDFRNNKHLKVSKNEKLQ
jgi:hypothetical protein